MKKQKGNLFVRDTVGDKIILTINFIALCLFLIIIAYPLLFVISASFSAGTATMSLSLIPKRFSLAGYEAVLQYKDIWMGYRNSLFYMVCGTALCLAMTVLMAYPLSRSDLPGKRALTFILTLTMWFSGGMIPSFILVNKLGLYDSYWALILPGLVSAYNIIIVRNFFAQTPVSLEESAKLDGAGEMTVLVRIFLPLSLPVLATITLWLVVGYWNTYLSALLYLSTRAKYTLQLVLRPPQEVVPGLHRFAAGQGLLERNRCQWRPDRAPERHQAGAAAPRS